MEISWGNLGRALGIGPCEERVAASSGGGTGLTGFVPEAPADSELHGHPHAAEVLSLSMNISGESPVNGYTAPDTGGTS